MECNNAVNISVIVYTSLMRDNNYTRLTNTAISVPFETNLTTNWIAEYPGPNYLEFVITESANNVVKTGVWYHVVESAKHEIEVRGNDW